MQNKAFVEKQREGEDSTTATADRRPRSIWNRCYATQRRRRWRRGQTLPRNRADRSDLDGVGERDGFTKTTLQHTAHNSAEPREGEIKPKLRDSGARARLLTFLSSNRMCNQTTELLEQKALRFRRRDNNDRSFNDKVETAAVAVKVVDRTIEY